MLFPVLPFIIKSYGQTEVILGILMGTFSLFQFLAAPVLGSLSDSYGRKPVLILTQAGTLLSWVVLWIAYMLPNQELFGFVLLPILVVFLSRVFDGITWWNASVAQAVLADMSSPEDRSKVFGMNGAVFGFALLVWPALGSFSVASGIWFLGTAILWACISLITLWIMIFFLRESLHISQRKKELLISFKEINVFSQIMKWWAIPTVRYAIFMKVLCLWLLCDIRVLLRCIS
jgi:DHA1 family tetracycline resistance protein-like MFS transporter